MITHPIHVSARQYRGNDPKRLRKHSEESSAAMALERLINGMLLEQERPVQIYLYYDIARASGYPIELVRKLCFAIDCGGNGFTAIKPGMTYEEAMSAHSAA
ncbi:hypothetical protein [Xanthomonas cannabis]|uniref:hypothetical protein n=1 Tax=Xanthomonas cannabis TaxID=1885674 RepID=UPI0033B97241